MDTPKTIKVRIPVAVDGAGKWSTCAWCFPDAGGADADEALSASVENLDSGHELQSVVWIEAEIPIPQAATVQAPGQLDDDLDRFLNYAANYGDGCAAEHGQPMPARREIAFRPLQEIASRINARLAHQLQPVTPAEEA